jgi:putative membrane protein
LEQWELSDLRDRAGAAVDILKDAVTGLDADSELQEQLSQLNIPLERERNDTPSSSSGKIKAKSNLAIPNPANLPLAMLRLMEIYVIGLADVEPGKGGWIEAKRERMLGIVKALSGNLGEAERLRHSEFDNGPGF